MTVYEFGDKNNPVIMLLPGTMCYWRGNFRNVIDELLGVYPRDWCMCVKQICRLNN